MVQIETYILSGYLARPALSVSRMSLCLFQSSESSHNLLGGKEKKKIYGDLLFLFFQVKEATGLAAG